MVVVQSAYGTMPTTGGRAANSNKWIMPAMAGLAAVVLTGTAVVMMSSSASVELAQKHHSLVRENSPELADRMEK